MTLRKALVGKAQEIITIIIGYDPQLVIFFHILLVILKRI